MIRSCLCCSHIGPMKLTIDKYTVVPVYFPATCEGFCGNSTHNAINKNCVCDKYCHKVHHGIRCCQDYDKFCDGNEPKKTLKERKRTKTEQRRWICP